MGIFIPDLHQFQKSIVRLSLSTTFLSSYAISHIQKDFDKINPLVGHHSERIVYKSYKKVFEKFLRFFQRFGRLKASSSLRKDR